MSAGSDNAVSGWAADPVLEDLPGQDVVAAALRLMYADVIKGSSDAQGDLAAVGGLVIDAIDACRNGQQAVMISLIAAISVDHGREGVGRAISILCQIAEQPLRRQGQPDRQLIFQATRLPGLSRDGTAILERSAQLANELLSATLAEDGARLAAALKNMSDETFDPVLSIFVSHAAAIVPPTDDISALIDSAPDRWLCLITQA